MLWLCRTWVRTGFLLTRTCTALKDMKSQRIYRIGSGSKSVFSGQPGKMKAVNVSPRKHFPRLCTLTLSAGN